MRNKIGVRAALVLALALNLAATPPPVVAAAGGDKAVIPTARAAKFVSPEAAAQGLYKAWRKRSRRAARKVATAGAINTLFGNSWKDWGPMKFKGCEANGTGISTCRYMNNRGGVLEMEVEGGASAGGYNVTAVSLFSAND